MKFLILLAFFFTFSCNSPDYQNSAASQGEGVGLDDIAGSRGNDGSKPIVASDADKRDRQINNLRDEEVYLSKQRRQYRKNRQGFAGVRSNKFSSYTICRRFEGCQRFCSDWLDYNADCNQWATSTVVQSWYSMLDSLNSEQLIQNAQWVAMHEDVSVFLKAVDFNPGVMDKIISRLSMEACPFSEGLDIYHSKDTEKKVSLYLAHPEGREQGVKTIMDSEHFEINVNIFRGSVNKCLNEKKLSLSESMLAYENQLGFQLMHQKIADSCGHREECIQLAYCKIQSKPVWSHLEQVKDSDAFNISVQAENCSYENFNSLPSIQL